jgi:hypothetical protein
MYMLTKSISENFKGWDQFEYLGVNRRMENYYFIIIIIILLQMGFSPVAVVQQVHNRQVNTHYTK